MATQEISHQGELQLLYGTRTGPRKLLLWGTGSLCEAALPLLDAVVTQRPAHLIDSNSALWGSELHGLPVQGPDALATEAPESTLILIASSFTDQIRSKILEYGEFSILPLYQYDVLKDISDRFLAKFPDKAAGWHGRGLACSTWYSQENLFEAERCFERAVALDPDHAAAWFQLGMICLETRNLDRAGQAFHQAAARSPQPAKVHMYIAELLAHEPINADIIEHHLRQAVALDPKISQTAVADLAEWKKPAATKHAPTVARYPSMSRLQGDLKACIRRDVLGNFEQADRFIAPETCFFTMGSCFASNIAQSMKRLGLQAENISIGEEVNSTYANRYLLDWVLGRQTPDNIAERFENIFSGHSTREDMLEMLRAADAFIYTVGVAPAFFDRETGHFVMPHYAKVSSRSLASRFKFRMTTVSENRDNLFHIIANLRSINPTLRIFLTVSPVPLSATFERESAVIADCVSKSTLRVAVEEVVTDDREGIYYWPSFEIVRWIGGHLPSVFGVDNQISSHISLRYIDMIMELFLETLSIQEEKRHSDLESADLATLNRAL